MRALILSYFLLCRCFYAGWAFENGLKWPEALALYNRAGEFATEAKTGLQQLTDKADVQ